MPRRRSFSSASATRRSSTTTTTAPSVVRLGPLYLGLILIFVVPLLLISMWSTTLVAPPSNTYQNGEVLNTPDGFRGGSSNRQHQNDSTTSYTGVSYHRQALGIQSSKAKNIVAQTENAFCATISQEDDNASTIHVEIQSLIQVVLIDSSGQVLLEAISEENTGNSIISASSRMSLPSTANGKGWVRPLSRYTGSKEEAPYWVAQQIVRTVIPPSSLPSWPKFDQPLSINSVQSHRVDVDIHGIPIGSVPSDYHGLQFLGRHRSLSEYGAGFVYSYMAVVPDGSFQETDDSNLRRIPIQTLQSEFILQERIVDTRSMTSLLLALTARDQQRGATRTKV